MTTETTVISDSTTITIVTTATTGENTTNSPNRTATTIQEAKGIIRTTITAIATTTGTIKNSIKTQEASNRDPMILASTMLRKGNELTTQVVAKARSREGTKIKEAIIITSMAINSNSNSPIKLRVTTRISQIRINLLLDRWCLHQILT